MVPVWVYQLIVMAVVGIVSGGIGALVTNAIQSEKIRRLEKDVDGHEDNFKNRVVFRDMCGNCKDHGTERHNEVLFRMDELKGEFKSFKKQSAAIQTNTLKLFQECMDDLVAQLKTA